MTYKRLFRWRWNLSNQKEELDSLIRMLSWGGKLSKKDLKRVEKLSKMERKFY